MAERIVDRDFYDDNDDLLGFDWGGVISGGIQAGVGLLTGGGRGGQSSAPANACQGQEVGCLDTLIVQYNQQMTAATTAGATPAQLADIIASYLTVLNDPSVISQSEGGAYLSNTKNQMQQRMQSLRTQVTTTPAPTQTAVTDPATGQQTTVTTATTAPAATDSQLIDGIDNKFLLLGAAGIAAFYFLARD